MCLKSYSFLTNNFKSVFFVKILTTGAAFNKYPLSRIKITHFNILYSVVFRPIKFCSNPFSRKLCLQIEPIA